MAKQSLRRSNPREAIMRVFVAAAILVALAQPAFAQKSIPKYGEVDKDKSPQEKAAEKEAEDAYSRSLKNIPDKGPTDPWGSVRAPDAPKTEAKPRAKAGNKAGATAAGAAAPKTGATAQ
jgi:hypothetical protein